MLVVALKRGIYRDRMIEPGETFDCADEVLADGRTISHLALATADRPDQTGWLQETGWMKAADPAEHAKRLAEQRAAVDAHRIRRQAAIRAATGGPNAV